MQIVETRGGYVASKVGNLGLKSLTCRQVSVSVSLSFFRGRAETSWFTNTRVRSWDDWRHGCSEDFFAVVSTINPSVCPERSDIILGFHQLLEPLPPWARSRVWMTAVHFLSCLIMPGMIKIVGIFKFLSAMVVPSSLIQLSFIPDLHYTAKFYLFLLWYNRDFILCLVRGSNLLVHTMIMQSNLNTLSNQTAFEEWLFRGVCLVKLLEYRPMIPEFRKGQYLWQFHCNFHHMIVCRQPYCTQRAFLMELW